MTTQEYLCRHFARMGARVVVRGPRPRQRTKIAIDLGRDRSGEMFVIGCEDEVAMEVLDVQPRAASQPWGCGPGLQPRRTNEHSVRTTGGSRRKRNRDRVSGSLFRNPA